ncbi:MBL fold metallo-hydrolase [soil metagenome]
MEENDLKVKILGCGDAFGSGGRFNTCFYLQGFDRHILIDCGASALISMKKFSIKLEKIEYIILSHLHGDHFGGLPFYFLDAQFNQKREEPLTIIGPQGTEEKVREITSLLYPGTDLDSFDYQVHFREYDSNENIELKNLKLTTFPVIHSEDAMPHGLRLRIENKIFAFSGDTEWTEALIDLSKDADLFICESNYYNKKASNHLDYHTIMTHKKRFSCKKIILNHLGDEMISKIEELDLKCAFDGQEIII